MIKIDSELDQVCIAKAREAGQEHVFDGWEQLGAEAQRALIERVRAIDFQLIQQLTHQCGAAAAESGDDQVLMPPRIELPPSKADDPQWHDECARAGRDAIAGGKLALVMASGSTLRGPAGEPIGFVPIGPVSGKTIFQLLAEKVRAIGSRHKVSLLWAIVTHPAVHDETCEYFRKNGYFGLRSSDVVFFPQPLLPLFDKRGKFVLSEPGRIAMESNGDGGVFFEMLRPERLAELRERGIEHVLFFKADNPLVRIGDPVFLGRHILSGSEASSKAVRRLSSDGDGEVFCRICGSGAVVAHSELGDEDRRRVNADGEATFQHASMSVHLFSRAFFERAAEQNLRLPPHVHQRTQEHVDRRGKKVRPTEPNCVQIRFLFSDALRLAQRCTLVEHPREEEFSVVENTAGDRSPQTAQRDLSRLFARWLRAAGATFKNAAGDDGSLALEVSPLFALDEDELRARIELPLVIDKDLYLCPTART